MKHDSQKLVVSKKIKQMEPFKIDKFTVPCLAPLFTNPFKIPSCAEGMVKGKYDKHCTLYLYSYSKPQENSDQKRAETVKELSHQEILHRLKYKLQDFDPQYMVLNELAKPEIQSIRVRIVRRQVAFFQEKRTVLKDYFINKRGNYIS